MLTFWTIADKLLTNADKCPHLSTDVDALSVLASSSSKGTWSVSELVSPIMESRVALLSQLFLFFDLRGKFVQKLAVHVEVNIVKGGYPLSNFFYNGDGFS